MGIRDCVSKYRSLNVEGIAIPVLKKVPHNNNTGHRIWTCYGCSE